MKVLYLRGVVTKRGRNEHEHWKLYRRGHGVVGVRFFKNPLIIAQRFGGSNIGSISTYDLSKIRGYW